VQLGHLNCSPQRTTLLGVDLMLTWILNTSEGQEMNLQSSWFPWFKLLKESLHRNTATRVRKSMWF
jgi:hypothetical protein